MPDRSASPATHGSTTSPRRPCAPTPRRPTTPSAARSSRSSPSGRRSRRRRARSPRTRRASASSTTSTTSSSIGRSSPVTPLMSRATPIALLPRPNGTSLVIHVETRTEDGAPVNEQYVTEFFRGIEADESVGERAPDHRLDEDGADPLAEVAVSDRRGSAGSLCGSVGRRLRDPPRRRFRTGGWAARTDRPRPLHDGVRCPRRSRGGRGRRSASGAPGRGALLGAALSRRHRDHAGLAYRRRLRLRVARRRRRARSQGRPARARMIALDEDRRDRRAYARRGRTSWRGRPSPRVA